jgi:hypothetical protein
MGPAGRVNPRHPVSVCHSSFCMLLGDDDPRRNLLLVKLRSCDRQMMKSTRSDRVDTITGQEAARHPAAQPHPCQQHVYHTQALTAPSPHGQLVQHPSTTNAHVHSHGSWTPAPNMSVARSRAQRRFWVAMIYAWLIYLLVG